MEQEAATLPFVTRDRVITLGALAILVCLSWLYLLRAPQHGHDVAPPVAVVAPSVPVPPPPVVEEPHGSGHDEAEEDDGIPRFP